MTQLELARQHHLAGRIKLAAFLYDKILTADPGNGGALHGMAVLMIQVNRYNEARELMDHAIAAVPDEWRYHSTLGQVFMELGKREEAVAAYQMAVNLSPHSADALFGLGSALHSIGRREQAIDAFRRSLAARPDHIPSLNNLANALAAGNKFDESIALYRRVLEIKPDYIESISNLGATLKTAGRINEAIEALKKGLTLNIQYAPLYINLGNALLVVGKIDEAVFALRMATEIDGKSEQAWYNLGTALMTKGALEESIQAFRRATQIRPHYAEAFNNLGTVLARIGDNTGAAEAYLQAAKVRPNFVDAMSNAATALRYLGQMDRAEELLRQALQIKPNFSVGWCNLGNILKDCGRLDEALDCYRRAIEINPADASSHSNLAYSVYFHPDFDGEKILRENLRWNDVHARPLAGQIRPHQNDRSANRRIRVGYVSPDFRQHCQSLFTIPLLSHHDHSAFEIFCYSSAGQDDDVSRRIMGYADTWRVARGISDEKLAGQIREDQIDILVDLTMHMSFGRLLLFARNPAPVQVAWLAYPGTTGLAAIDYRLTDPHLDPPEYDRFYSEQSIRLPDTFWCYDAMTPDLTPNPLPAVDAGFVTFGCLNNSCKFNERTLAMWTAVMSQVKDSRIVVMLPPGAHREKMRERFASAGIAGTRVEFVEYRPRLDYLRTYHRIDLGLDTFPYNGHTTSLDSYWMGAPVVSRVGETAVGRAGWSQLTNLSLRELAAFSDEDFVQIAVTLANDLPRLGELRSTLRPRMEKSPLMNGELFARNVEAAYRQMWITWCGENLSDVVKREDVKRET